MLSVLGLGGKKVAVAKVDDAHQVRGGGKEKGVQRGVQTLQFTGSENLTYTPEEGNKKKKSVNKRGSEKYKEKVKQLRQ